jgi:hypothetical protein
MFSLLQPWMTRRNAEKHGEKTLIHFIAGDSGAGAPRRPCQPARAGDA